MNQHISFFNISLYQLKESLKENGDIFMLTVN